MTRSLPLVVFLMTMPIGSSIAFAQEDQKPEPAKQIYCPVAPEEEIDPEVFTEYEGKPVYFCCERCRARFLRDPRRYATRLITVGAPVEKQRPEPTPATHPAHEHEPMPSAIQPTSENDEENHGEESHEHGPSIDQKGTEHGHGEHEHDQGPRWVNWIGRFHPAMVNLPIGALIAAANAEALFLIRRRPFYTQAARYCVWFAALSGAVAGVLGWCFGGFHLVDSVWLLTVHRWLGTSTALCLICLLLATEQAHREPARRPGLYRALLFGVTVLVAITGFFGGAMVYGIDHYTR